MTGFSAKIPDMEPGRLPDGFYQAWRGDFQEGVDAFVDHYGRPPRCAIVAVGREIDGAAADGITLYEDSRNDPHEVWFGFGLWHHLKGQAQAEPETPEIATLAGAIIPPPERKTAGRPPKSYCRCPFCQSKIDWNDLGFWWGWEREQAPPYWQELCRFILSRDGHRCKSCGEQQGLQVHHIIPKESGGQDSARNLQTLCNGCRTKAHD